MRGLVWIGVGGRGALRGGAGVRDGWLMSLFAFTVLEGLRDCAEDDEACALGCAGEGEYGSAGEAGLGDEASGGEFAEDELDDSVECGYCASGAEGDYDFACCAAPVR